MSTVLLVPDGRAAPEPSSTAPTSGTEPRRFPPPMRFPQRPLGSVRPVARAVVATRLLGAVAVVLVAAAWRDWFGVLAALAATLTLEYWLRHRVPAAVHRERAAAAAQLPFAADLVAAALRAGAPPDRAVEVVGHALDDPLGVRLVAVAARLRGGADPADAWAPLADIPGGAPMVGAARRTAESGAALAGALNRLADDLRSSRATHVQAVAERVTVLIVLPLGLCFLPAFLLAGVVPVALAVLQGVLQPLP